MALSQISNQSFLSIVSILIDPYHHEKLEDSHSPNSITNPYFHYFICNFIYVIHNDYLNAIHVNY